MNVCFEFTALFHSAIRWGKKGDIFKSNIYLDSVESFLYCLCSSENKLQIRTQVSIIFCFLFTFFLSFHCYKTCLLVDFIRRLQKTSRGIFLDRKDSISLSSLGMWLGRVCFFSTKNYRSDSLIGASKRLEKFGLGKINLLGCVMRFL